MLSLRIFAAFLPTLRSSMGLNAFTMGYSKCTLSRASQIEVKWFWNSFLNTGSAELMTMFFLEFCFFRNYIFQCTHAHS